MNPILSRTIKRLIPRNNLFFVFLRALRLPFIGASLIPFTFGSYLPGAAVNAVFFILGFIGTACIHISANLINDYSDSLSGRDWQDKTYYGLFGGSKLIQEGVLSERFYFVCASVFLGIAAVSMAALAVMMRSMLVIQFFLLIVILSWGYSLRPFHLSYRMWGEPVVFILFGPALVMGGYFIQTEIFPDARSFLMSLPFGFLTTAILLVNEVPDAVTDSAVGKKTWVTLTGVKYAHIVYAILVSFGYVYIGAGIILGYLPVWASTAVMPALLCVKPFIYLKRYYSDKTRLLTASRLTIISQFSAGILLLFSLSGAR